MGFGGVAWGFTMFMEAYFGSTSNSHRWVGCPAQHGRQHLKAPSSLPIDLGNDVRGRIMFSTSMPGACESQEGVHISWKVLGTCSRPRPLKTWFAFICINCF